VRDVDLHYRMLDEESRADVLSAAERSRAERFRFERDRQAFIARRIFLREVLAGYLGADPSAVEFEYNEFGKPLIPSRKVHFSASHSAGFAVIAVSRIHAVGVDVERIQAVDYHAIAHRFFSAGEANELDDLESFYRIWTRKEACLKARGIGLSGSLEGCEDGCLVETWTPAPGFIAALAARRPGRVDSAVTQPRPI
jgi:4'-phosphopantetheinyl transferase